MLLKWLFLLTKRLYKKLTFLFILLLIPVSVALISLSAEEDSGFVTVALALEDKNDAVAMDIAKELSEGSELVHFAICSEKNQAMEMINTGKADSVWLFPEDMEEKLKDFVVNKNDRKPVVEIINRENSTALSLVREKLYGTVYKYCAKAEFLRFVKEEAPELSALDDSELLKYVENYDVMDELFVFSSPFEGETAKQTGYVMAPIRGILSVILLLGTLAATIFYMQDEKRGIYDRVALGKKPLVFFANLFITALNLALPILIALFVSGVGYNVGYEILCMLIYILVVSAFSLALSSIIRGIGMFSAITPFIIIASMVLCPIFIDATNGVIEKFIFPPSYYLYMLQSANYIVHSFIYIAAGTILFLVASRFRKRKI